MHVFTHPYDLQVYFCLYAPIYMKYKGESGMCAGAHGYKHRCICTQNRPFMCTLAYTHTKKKCI